LTKELSGKVVVLSETVEKQYKIRMAGDFYDVFTLGNEKRVGLVIADVCDKGAGAALFMALFRSFIRVLSGSAHSDVI
jgi:serine phosphatase RsbU (regulator of sigma subunit)